ncbi:unnamed protein product [Dibothriocephalus latus]|uniref:Uncharacterized protein n=1 Tax=Dibothriocephalus latus TaxID=60516 RepID=A0A3P6VDA3_DIBLA|nr:unnamed protein product [Dibothriocephalus latus]
MEAAADAYQEVSTGFIQALFRPLLIFLSSNSMDNSPTLTDQLANILADVGRPDISESGIVLNTVLFYLSPRLFQLTKCAKQLEAAIRQLADRITDVAIEHCILVTLQPPRASMSALMRRLEIGAEDYTEPAIPSPVRFANTAWHNVEELEGLRRDIWLTLETAYICLLRSSETTNDVTGCDLLSVDLQNLHSSGLMLVQCLVGLTAPFDDIAAIHMTDGFYANGVSDGFEENFEHCNWLKVLDPKLFPQQSSPSDSELSACRTRVALSNFAAGLHFDSITALNLIFAQNARLSRILLAPPSWMTFCFPENCAFFTDVASIYKAFYRIFATCPEHDDYYSALLLPLLQSLSSVECLDVQTQFPLLPNFPAWLSALLDFLGDFLDEIYGRFHSIVLQRLAFDDSLSSERATELLSQFQGIESLVKNLPLPQTPAVWLRVFPEGRLPCSCSFALTASLLEPVEIDSKPCEPTEGDNSNGGSFAVAFKHTLIDCIVDLLSVPVQALPEGLLLFFNNLDKFAKAEGSPLSCFRFLGNHAVTHFLLLAFWWKIGSQTSVWKQRKEAGMNADASDPLWPQKLVMFAVIAYMINSEVQPEMEIELSEICTLFTLALAANVFSRLAVDVKDVL